MTSHPLMRGDARRWIGWGAAALAAVLLIGFGRTVFGVSRPQLHSTQFAMRTAAVGPVPRAMLATVEHVELGRGQVPAAALQTAGFHPGQVARAMQALSEVVDVRRIRPRDSWLTYASENGDLVRLEYQRIPEERVVLEMTGTGYTAELVRESVELYVKKIEGEVFGTLSGSMIHAGGSQGILVQFAQLFAWDFDFATDTRAGDRFQLLVEERRIAGRRTGYGTILAARYHPRDAQRPIEAFHHQWGEKQGGYYTAGGESLRKFFLKSPLSFTRISSGFTHKRLHPILKKYRPHLGIDYAAPMGTPVIALGNGKIAHAGWKGGYGRTVQVKHNGTYMTQYAHLKGYAKGIRPGVRVRQGQVIGYVGSSGLSTGPHLDFRVRENGQWINPLKLGSGGQAEPIPDSERVAFESAREETRTLLESLSPGSSVPLRPGEDDLPEGDLARLDTPQGS